MTPRRNKAQPCGLGQVVDSIGAGEKSRTPDLRITNATIFIYFAGLSTVKVMTLAHFGNAIAPDPGLPCQVWTTGYQRMEVRELRKANEILRLASAFFAQAELDRRFKL